MSIDKRLKQLNERAIEFRLGKARSNGFVENKKSVLAQGTHDENMYIVREGIASVVRQEEFGKVPLVQLYKGDYFGTIPFLELGHEPEFASVMAGNDIKVRKIDTTQLKEEYNQLSTTFKNFVDNVSTCVNVSTKVVCNYQKKFCPTK